MAFIKSFIRRSIWSLGWDLRREATANTEEHALRNLINAVRPAAVLDVGANEGQFADKVREIGYRGLIISFEALPAVHAKLESRAASDHSTWMIAPCAALGRENGIVDINIAANSQSSSILRMNDSHLRAAPHSAYVGKQSVRMSRLDELALACIPRDGDLLLKIDTQGYEKDVLLGATNLLPRIAALQIELSLVALYENAPTFTGMLEFLQSLGFEVFGFVPNFFHPKSGRALQLDGFFVRSGTLEQGGVANDK